jgi:hypothetical protein
VTHDAVTHDVLLARGDGSRRKFRVYGRPKPGCGDAITLPVDGQLIRARVTVSSDKPKKDQSVDAELVELVE